MKSFLLWCVLGLLASEGLALGYHEDVGIPEAERIRQGEARAISSRIIGGMPSASGENPYLVGLRITLMTGQLSVCGGTLLSNTRVLTAGQCWYDGYHQGKDIKVVLGTTYLFYYNGYTRTVSSIAVHPGFDARTTANDLAMLTLSYSISFNSYLKPALLPTPKDVNTTFEGMSARVSGFGKTSDFSPIGPKQAQSAVSVPVMNWYECYWSLGSSITRSVLCTSGANGWGPCAGDTGGPLVLKNYANGSDLLIGVTSIQSPLSCQYGFPTGYMRVTAYLDWIQSNL